MALDPGLDNSEFELSDDLRGVIKSELMPGERLIWASRAMPKPEGWSRPRLVGATLVLALTTVSVVCAAAFLRDPGHNEGFAVIAISVGVVDGLILLGLIAGLATRAAERRGRGETVYALTDRRVIVRQPSPDRKGVQVFSIDKGKVLHVHRVEYRDGTGDVVLSYKTREAFPYGFPPGLEGISDVRRVEELVRRTLVGDGDLSD